MRPRSNYVDWNFRVIAVAQLAPGFFLELVLGDGDAGTGGLGG